MAASHGHVSHPKEAQAEATNSGLQSVRRTARVMASNIRQRTTAHAAHPGYSADRLMAASPGRPQLVFLTRPNSEHSTWTATATFLLAEKARMDFGARDRAMRRTEASRQLLIESPPSISAARLCSVVSIQRDLLGKPSWRSTIPAPRLAITFTCLPVCSPTAAATAAM